MATPFKTKDVSEEISSKDIKSLMEQANYTNKYLQVSRYLRLTFIFDSHIKLASLPQFIVLFVGIAHIFMFSLILLSKYSQFYELM